MLREEIQKIIEHSTSSDEAALLIVFYLEEAGLNLDENGWLDDDSWWQGFRDPEDESENEDIEKLRQKLETTLA